jgi:hypothetical protein
MNKRALLLIGLLALLAAPSWGQTRTYHGFQLNWRTAPPPPRIYFSEEPRVRYMSQSRVYVVTNVDRYGVDMFRYGRFWYMTRDGYWYRARGYRGPFYAIDPRDVPDRIYAVPTAWWRHRPSGWRDRYAYRERDYRDRYGYRDRDYENRAGYNDEDRDTYLGFRVDVTDAPAPPRLYFRGQPDAMYVPETGVYVVEDTDIDMFRYGDYWYVADNGYWYRGTSYRGPFVVISARSVPASIYDTPDRHWKQPPMRDDNDRRWNGSRSRY